METEHIRYDAARGALWLRMPARFTVTELRVLLTTVEAAMLEHRPSVIVRNATAVVARNLSPLHRQVAAEHLRTLFDDDIAPSLEIVVLPNSVLRGVVTAVSWIFSPPWERSVVTDEEEAEQALSAYLAGRDAGQGA